MSSPDPVLVLDQVAKSFPAPGGGGEVRVLESVSLVVDPAASVAIVGPSGSGKSTLLGIAGTLEAPSAGVVRVAGRAVAGLDAKGLAALRRSAVGFVFQRDLLLPHLTALENVLLPLLAAPGGVAGEGEARARTLLADVGLAHRSDHKPSELSGGERQRVALARALVSRPQLLLADEPTGALDRRTADEIGDLLARLNAEHRTALVVVTHAASLAARMAATYELDAGRLVERPRP